MFSYVRLQGPIIDSPLTQQGVCGDSRDQADHQRGDDHHGPVVDRPLLVPGGDPAPLLEPVHTPLHCVASPVGVRIKARLATWATRAALVGRAARERRGGDRFAIEPADVALERALFGLSQGGESLKE